MKKYVYMVLAFLLANSVAAQLELPGRLKMSGDTTSDRQILGLSQPQALTDGVSAATLRNQYFQWVQVNGNDTLRGELPFAVSDPGIGWLVTFVTDTTNIGPVGIELNGGPWRPLFKYVDQPLDSADLFPGQPYTAAFDGQSFQLLSQVYRACPKGSFPLSRDACIQAQPDTALNFYAAALRCGSKNARLCTFAEWHTACTMDGRLLATVLDYEWVDHAANSINLAKRVGINAITLQPDCFDGGHRSPTLPTRYRCCYDR